MAETLLLDTNVLLRYLTNDDPRKAARCAALLERAADGKVKLVLTDLCLAELVWTLESFYKLERPEIARHLEAVITAPGLTCSDLAVWLDVLRLFGGTTVSLIDCYHTVLASRDKHRICSYDRDFDRFKTVQRIEP